MIDGKTGWVGKTAVMGLLERHGEVRTYVLTNVYRSTLQGHVHASVAPDSQVFTEASSGYTGLAAHYVHNVIDHAES